MVYFAIVLGYFLALFLLVRLFDLVHRWDEEDERMLDSFNNEMRKKAAQLKVSNELFLHADKINDPRYKENNVCHPCCKQGI